MKEQGLRGAVVLLAPREQLPFEAPVEVPQRSLQALSTIVSANLATGGSDVQRFLLLELLDYLRMAGLADPEVMGPEHLVALSYADEAEAGLAGTPVKGALPICRSTFRCHAPRRHFRGTGPPTCGTTGKPGRSRVLYRQATGYAWTG